MTHYLTGNACVIIARFDFKKCGKLRSSGFLASLASLRSEALMTYPPRANPCCQMVTVMRDVSTYFTNCAYQVEPPLLGLTPRASSLAAICPSDKRPRLDRGCRARGAIVLVYGSARANEDAYGNEDLRCGPISFDAVAVAGL